MENEIKSGKEILKEFFSDIEDIENVDKKIAKALAKLFSEGKLTDTNVKNKLQELREENDEQN